MQSRTIEQLTVHADYIEIEEAGLLDGLSVHGLVGVWRAGGQAERDEPGVSCRGFPAHEHFP
ncbi:MAG: hypothetical protein Q8M09_10140 [Pseudomonadota bacterium]|nr:hypothetical protein [Pseudomonadota bacterium]MDP1904588.1 hypothetical protein [Pseudomonadota bacterium]MDP2353213.1 hypothetical protein [Pseudomonadota bacterium]